jgi:hypothetical protein
VIPGYSEAKAVAAAHPLPQVKKMMWTQRVEFFLNWKTEP